MTIVCAI